MVLRVIGVDHSSKKDLVLESGAEHFIPLDGTDDLATAVKEVTDGLGAHAVIVLTSSNKAYDGATSLLRRGPAGASPSQTETLPWVAVPCRRGRPG